MDITKYSHIIFDMDHTLAKLDIDWAPWHEGLRTILSAYDPAFPQSGEVTHEMSNDAIKKYGSKVRDEINAYNEKFEDEALQGITPIAATLALLKNLDKRQTAYILTSNSTKTAMPILEQLDITDRFAKIITRDDVEYIKPNPQPFSLIHDKNISRKNYLMIGDSDSDRGFAKNAGIDFVHVTELQ